jgi:hypothetical protein
MMENRKNENLEELMGKFLGQEEGRRAAGEIKQGENLFASNPAPEPGQQLIENIREQVSARLSKPRVIRRGYQVAVVAAAVIVWGWIGIRFFVISRPGNEIERTVAVNTTSTAASTGMVASLDQTPAEDIWSDWDEDDVDSEITSIDEEIESIEGSIFALRLGEQDIENGEILADVEIEMVEIDNSFWKG